MCLLHICAHYCIFAPLSHQALMPCLLCLHAMCAVLADRDRARHVNAFE
jgi:hypothetical protein